MSRSRLITDESFDREVLQRARLVLVSFFAPWCTPCQSTGAIADLLADAFADDVHVVRVNTDTSPVTTATYSANHVPTCLLFWCGTPVKAIPSHLPAEALSVQIRTAIARVSAGGAMPPVVPVERTGDQAKEDGHAQRGPIRQRDLPVHARHGPGTAVVTSPGRPRRSPAKRTPG